ncbi:MAG: hypothetical protein AB7O57_00895 [Hyphomicrobiaceae bacterium]
MTTNVQSSDIRELNAAEIDETSGGIIGLIVIGVGIAVGFGIMIAATSGNRGSEPLHSTRR